MFDLVRKIDRFDDLARFMRKTIQAHGQIHTPLDLLFNGGQGAKHPVGMRNCGIWAKLHKVLHQAGGFFYDSQHVFHLVGDAGGNFAEKDDLSVFVIFHGYHPWLQERAVRRF